MKRINRRLAALLLSTLLAAGALGGCQQPGGGSGDAQSSSEGASSSGQQPAAIPEEDYQSLWESTVCIASKHLLEDDFSSPQEVDSYAALNYIVEQMEATGTAEPYRVPGEGLDEWVIPEDVVFQQAQQYFGDQLEENLKSLGELGWYNPEEKTFNTWVNGSYPNGGYPYGSYKVGENDLYVAIREAADNGDGTVTVVLEDYNRLKKTDKAGEKLQKIHELTLRAGEEGGWQIVSKSSYLVNQPEIKTGGFSPLTSLGGLTAEGLANAGVTLVTWGEDLLLWSTDYSQRDPETYCLLLGPDGEVKGETTFTYSDINDHLFDVTPYGEDMAFYFREGEGVKIVVLDKNFQKVKTIDNLSQLVGEELYFETVALSPDGQTLAFVGDAGLYTVDLATGEKTLRGAHPKLSTGPSPGQAGDMYKGIIFLDNTRLMARRVSYEAGPGYGYFDLGKNTVQLIDIPVGYATSDYFDRDGFTVVRYQEGQLPTLVQRYRFDSGAFTVYEVPYTGIIPDPVAFGEMAYYFGQKNGETRLYALNLATGQAVDTGVWVTGAQTRIAAVTEDNRVLFSYSAPAGGGIGITEARLGIEGLGM